MLLQDTLQEDLHSRFMLFNFSSDELTWVIILKCFASNQVVKSNEVELIAFWGGVVIL